MVCPVYIGVYHSIIVIACLIQRDFIAHIDSLWPAASAYEECQTIQAEVRSSVDLFRILKQHLLS